MIVVVHACGVEPCHLGDPAILTGADPRKRAKAADNRPIVSRGDGDPLMRREGKPHEGIVRDDVGEGAPAGAAR